MGSSPTQSPKPKCVGQVTHTTYMPMDIRKMYDFLADYISQVGLRYNDEAMTYAHHVSPRWAESVGVMQIRVPTPALFAVIKQGGETHAKVHGILKPIMDYAASNAVPVSALITDEVLDKLKENYIGLFEPSHNDSRYVDRLAVFEQDSSLAPFRSAHGRQSIGGIMCRQLTYLKCELEDVISRINRWKTTGDDSLRIWIKPAIETYLRAAEYALGMSGDRPHGLQGVDEIRRLINRARPTAQLNAMTMQDKMQTVVDYAGNEIPVMDAVVLTAESEFEGEYIQRDDAYVGDVWTSGSEQRIIVTSDEAHDNVRELVSGDMVYISTMEDEIEYLHYGNHQGYFAWRDDCLYCEDDGEYYHVDDDGDYIFWNERTGEYQRDPVCNDLCHEYHHGFRRNFTTNDTLFTIGFEVEKEDEDVLNEWDLDDADGTDWCRETDGSLNDDDGFELVSPVFDLFDDKLDNQIKDSRVLRDHLNASTSSNCGGHINFGMLGIDGRDLFDKMQAYVPLFLTIYRHRLGNTYSRIQRKADDYKRAGKYSAIHVKGSYIEIRVPSAVKSVSNLLWRRDLMRIIAQNLNAKPLQVITAMLSPKTPLGAHLRQVYTTDEQIHKIVSIYAQFADDMYSSFSFTSDGAGVFIKSAARRLKNRKVKGTTIVSYTSEATDRLRNTFGHSYITEAQGTLQFVDTLLND